MGRRDVGSPSSTTTFRSDVLRAEKSGVGVAGGGHGGVVSKAVVEAHTAGITAAMEYLHRHAGYTRCTIRNRG